ncbi:MAG: glycogen synthase [Bacilli bacterium]|nr:glycogen synthase [Bacilli bacterium]
MKIAMFSSEANPLAKSGGLADVAYSLSKELVKMGHDVILVMPLYKAMWKKEKQYKYKKVDEFEVSLSWRKNTATIYTTTIDGIKYYLVSNGPYFERDNLYSYPDDTERFAFYQIASVMLLNRLKYQADIIHVHDHQASFIPVLIKEKEGDNPLFSKTKFVLTIHNPAFRGEFDKFYLGDFYGLPDSIYDSGAVRFNNMVSTLKAAMIYCDKITTVSPTHRNELLDPNSEFHLNGVLDWRYDDFVGIVNGIDIKEWDSRKDPKIEFNYGITNLEEGKHANQAALLKSMNLKFYGGPVYGLVSRLSWQKGIGLVVESMRKALRQGANLVVLGSGEYELEQQMEELRREFPDTCGIYIGYSDDLAHKIYAGCDFFLMPSLFEPCGISQMVSQRYGTLPIVRYTGGLADTVEGYVGDNINSSNGIGFNNYDAMGMDYAIGMSRALYADQKSFYKVARNAMRLDRSWAQSAKNYEDLYIAALTK